MPDHTLRRTWGGEEERQTWHCIELLRSLPAQGSLHHHRDVCIGANSSPVTTISLPCDCKAVRSIQVRIISRVDESSCVHASIHCIAFIVRNTHPSATRRDRIFAWEKKSSIGFWPSTRVSRPLAGYHFRRLNRGVRRTVQQQTASPNGSHPDSSSASAWIDRPSTEYSV
jgi:hypothetical protein